MVEVIPFAVFFFLFSAAGSGYYFEVPLIWALTHWSPPNKPGEPKAWMHRVLKAAQHFFCNLVLVGEWKPA
ncbi:hypothetical protein DNFV4_01566 [Nitrospira tepida]|uniref:Uncharacterized protein n=1 Tax=Nitrospira tepida TaxID=2973512 RepID=A0AA86TB07_9BACT|nr:hypothetical protein DNFV4_01566 [Nitrospira tepida]